MVAIGIFSILLDSSEGGFLTNISFCDRLRYFHSITGMASKEQRLHLCAPEVWQNPGETPLLREIKAGELETSASDALRLLNAIPWKDEVLFGEVSKLSLEKKVRPPTNS